MFVSKSQPRLGLCTASAFTGLAMLCSSAVALAAVPAPAAYVKGTFQFVDFVTSYGSPPKTQSQWGTATFDGVGSISITYVANTDTVSARDVISNGSGTNTYQVAADGTITFGMGGSTARLSNDGNVLILNSPSATNDPEILVGIRVGAISGLNTAAGQLALNANTTGADNNASGALALMSNTTGSFNNAAGYSALSANTTGTNNNAQGSFALSANTTGYGNSAMGANAFLNLTTGFRDVGVGNNTGTNVLAGAYDTYVGWGAAGTVDETGVTRIGNPTYATKTYIAGLNSVVTGAALYLSSSGQVGVLASSERYKTDIATLPAPTDRLGQLRPVSFHLKSEPEGTLQYGLIAEEVAKIYPELVLHDQAGQIQGVRYDELAPLLLSEVQEQRRQLAKVDRLEEQLAAQAQRIRDLEQALTRRGTDSSAR